MYTTYMYYMYIVQGIEINIKFYSILCNNDICVNLKDNVVMYMYMLIHYCMIYIYISTRSHMQFIYENKTFGIINRLLATYSIH